MAGVGRGWFRRCEGVCVCVCVCLFVCVCTRASSRERELGEGNEEWAVESEAGKRRECGVFLY